MALPVAAFAAKAAVALVTDKRMWKAVAMIIAAALTPFILIIVCILGLVSGTANHNNAALELTFVGGELPATMPAEYRAYITGMRTCFSALEGAVTDIGSECEWEDGQPDMVRVKAVFYALYFGDGNLSLRASAARDFVDCFIEYETRTRIVEDENGEEYTEEYTVAIPIAELQTVYANVGAHVGRTLTPEDMININEIYLRVSRGDFSVGFGAVTITGEANNTHALIAELTAGDTSPAPTGGYTSPIPGDWRGLVSCEFGTGYAGHTGMDLALPEGTEIRAVADGTVLFTRASSTGYGVHVVINHGGGVATLYGHCSKILVGEGQRVTKGQTIALSGNTGRSTGPHLHLEFVMDGVSYNPRGYLS